MVEVQGVTVFDSEGNDRLVVCVPGKTSDGYHSIEELYAHRHALFIALASAQPWSAWKSLRHDDGSSLDGWFIAGMNLSHSKPITYHLPLSLWELLKVQEFDKAPSWDGHTSQDVIDRLNAFSRYNFIF